MHAGKFVNHYSQMVNQYVFYITIITPKNFIWQTQHKIEMDKRDGMFGPQPAMAVPPAQQMSRIDQSVPPSVGYAPQPAYGQPPPQAYGQPYGYPPAPPAAQGYPATGYPPAAYPPPAYPPAGYPPSGYSR